MPLELWFTIVGCASICNIPYVTNQFTWLLYIWSFNIFIFVTSIIVIPYYISITYIERLLLYMHLGSKINWIDHYYNYTRLRLRLQSYRRSFVVQAAVITIVNYNLYTFLVQAAFCAETRKVLLQGKAQYACPPCAY